MCGITASITLAGRSGYCSPNTDNLPADDDHKKRKLTNGLVHTQQHRDNLQLERQLARSLDAINHRGPDSRGTWISPDGNIGLGSCRLAINGLGPGGQQPFSNGDASIHAVVNGELYDHHRIRDEMVKLSGYNFQGGSDSEIVVALYDYYGPTFLSSLRGEFALALYDAKKQLFLAARDRSGVKPLFWTVFDGRLLLASEAKALLPFGWRPEWDVRSIVDKGWLTQERTIFKGLRKIRPGHYMTCLSLHHIAEGQYWDHDYPDKNTLELRTEQEMIEGVRAKMLDAVRVRLQADVPVGIHLSGGIDSAVVAGMAKHLLDRGEVKLGSDGNHRLRCFGVAFDKGSGYDESVIAQNTADFLGVDFQKVHMNEAELAANFAEAVWFDEQPHFELGFVGKHALSKLTRDSGLKTIISGQGSDEIFGGYDVYLRDYLREPDAAWPKNNLNETTRQHELAESEASMAKTFNTWTNDKAEKVPAHLSTEIPAFASCMTIPPLMTAPWVDSYFGTISPQITIIENIDVRIRGLIRTKWHPLHSALYVWNKTALPNMLLTNLSDRTEMSHSIEGRVPFLDHPLMEYVNALPPSMKIRYDPETGKLTEKWILRQASRPFITDEFMWVTLLSHSSPPFLSLPPPPPPLQKTSNTTTPIPTQNTATPTPPLQPHKHTNPPPPTALLRPINLPPQRTPAPPNAIPHHGTQHRRSRLHGLEQNRKRGGNGV
ncbi:MAG: hypothetical protein L6R40_007678 [Gallowayella cf. fulva]|nr:MAG: hypothetical protein L6R40_007678 [Xanthomendoza cf. fulva]